MRIVDIALLLQHRGRGIGGAIMLDLLNEAAEKGRPVSIHVEQNNPALPLYERLGFTRIGDTGVYFLMECRPAAPDEFLTLHECHCRIDSRIRGVGTG